MFPRLEDFERDFGNETKFQLLGSHVFNSLTTEANFGAKGQEGGSEPNIQSAFYS